jgi:hypothetical protein
MKPEIEKKVGKVTTHQVNISNTVNAFITALDSIKKLTI